MAEIELYEPLWLNYIGGMRIHSEPNYFPFAAMKGGALACILGSERVDQLPAPARASLV